MWIDRGNGQRVQIPVAVEQEGEAAIAAYLAAPPADAVVMAIEPEPVPAEAVTEDAEARALCAQHAVDPATIAGTGFGGRLVVADVTARLQAGPAARRSRPTSTEES
jgi:pyruvate dehydrogenase E2 component (dihydrolipoamide acetyltransferase)